MPCSSDCENRNRHNPKTENCARISTQSIRLITMKNKSILARIAVCQGCSIGRKDNRSSRIHDSTHLFGWEGERCISNLGTLLESI